MWVEQKLASSLNIKAGISVFVCLHIDYLNNRALYEVENWQVYCLGSKYVQCREIVR